MLCCSQCSQPLDPRRPWCPRCDGARPGVPLFRRGATTLIGLPGMADLDAAPGVTATLPGAAHPRSGAWEAPTMLDSPYPSVPLAEAWRPPPPVVPEPPAWRGWWLALPVVAALGWLLVRDQRDWDVALTLLGRLGLATATTLGIWVGALRQGRATWRGLRAPAAAAVLLAALGMLALASATPAANVQAGQAANSGDFARALTLYARAGTPADAAAVHLAWSRALAGKGDFAGAQTQAQAALAAATGLQHAAALGALGHALWLWGQQLLQQGDLAGARAKLQAAATLAPGTTDGDRAAAALAAPQPVTGHMVWLGGVPVPGLHVALVSAWRVDPLTGALVYSGQRLDAVTDDTGAFTFQGARPGVSYAFLWVGGAGDFVRLTSAGQPRYTITLLPLAPGDLGTVALSG